MSTACRQSKARMSGYISFIIYAIAYLVKTLSLHIIGFQKTY